MSHIEIDPQDALARWCRGMKAVTDATLPTLETAQEVASECGVTDSAQVVVIYLEALVTAILDQRIDEVLDELAGRCLLAEELLLVLTGSQNLDQVREWMASRGLKRVAGSS